MAKSLLALAAAAAFVLGGGADAPGTLLLPYPTTPGRTAHMHYTFLNLYENARRGNIKPTAKRTAKPKIKPKARHLLSPREVQLFEEIERLRVSTKSTLSKFAKVRAEWLKAEWLQGRLKGGPNDVFDISFVEKVEAAMEELMLSGNEDPMLRLVEEADLVAEEELLREAIGTGNAYYAATLELQKEQERVEEEDASPPQ